MDAPSPPLPSSTPPGRAELYAGLGLVGVLAFCLAAGAVDVWKNRAALRPLLPGDEAPTFVLPSVEPNQPPVQLSAYRGRVVLVDFWATWCPPCLRELPELARLHTELAPRGFSVLGLNREPEAPADVQAFVRERALPFPVALDTQDVGARYRVMSLPMTVLVGKDGRVAEIFMGYTDPARMRAAVEGALARGDG